MAGLVAWLKYAGARKVDGTPVASGRAYFYQPGTVSTQVTVYSDKDGLVVLPQPVALDAAGRATVYTKVACKVEVQQAVDFAVQAVEDRANTVNAKHVEVENVNYTGTSLIDGTQVLGGRTDLDTVLTGLVGTGGGTGGNYKENAGATQRTLQAAIGEFVKLQDYGAVGDDIADDTTPITNAIARALASNKPLWIEPGTYRFAGPISITLATAAGLRIMGANRAACILKNTSGSGNGITVDLGSAMESDIEMSDFTISNTGTSTGKAIELLNGNGPSLRRITVSGHRMGFDVSAVSFAMLEDCHVLSLDSNAASRGFKLGTGCIAQRCRVTAATNGKAFELAGPGSRADLCRATATTGTAFDMLASDALCTGCFVSGAATTGFNVGAVARSGAIGCTSTASTSDYTTDASATLPVDAGNVFTTRSQAENVAHAWFSHRPRVLRKYVQTAATATPTFTPDPTKPGEVQVFVSTYSAGAVTVTVANTATTGLVDGQVMTIVIENAQTSNGMTCNFGTQYKMSIPGGLATASYNAWSFQWRASASQWLLLWTTTGSSGTNGGTGGAVWSS